MVHFWMLSLRSMVIADSQTHKKGRGGVALRSPKRARDVRLGRPGWRTLGSRIGRGRCHSVSCRRHDNGDGEMVEREELLPLGVHIQWSPQTHNTNNRQKRERESRNDGP